MTEWWVHTENYDPADYLGFVYIIKNKKEMTFFEMYYQCRYDVLTTNSYNDNILGKFFRKDLE